VSEYTALDRQEAFDIEYWLLEEAKLKRMPAEKPLDRQIVFVVGAGSGIGRSLIAHLVGEGASVVAVDRDADNAVSALARVQKKVGMGIGVAGTGISARGRPSDSAPT
jgi:protein-L-isoaspartate O-methyltransferase